RGHQDGRRRQQPRQADARLPLVQEGALAARDPGDGAQRRQVRAGSPLAARHQLHHRRVPSQEAQGPGLVGVAWAAAISLLAAPIQKYVPSFPEKPWPITARQLLCHQAGIRHEADEEWGSTKHYTNLDDALLMFKDDPLGFPPGTKAEYSTFGFNLLGSVVEGA